jgi:hypothetical protein
MFKKSLLAAAILASATAGAATINNTPETIGVQGSANLAANSIALNVGGAITVTLGAEYAVGDIITFTVAGATLDGTGAAPELTYTADDADAGDGDANNDDSMTFGFLSLDTAAGTASFRVTETADVSSDGFTTTGGTITLTNLVVDTDTLPAAAGIVTLAYAADAGGFNLDAGTVTQTIFTMEDEFLTTTAATTEFDETIAVDKDRFSFLGNGDNADIFTVTTARTTPDNHAVGTGASAMNTVTYTLTASTAGGFQFLVDAEAADEDLMLTITGSDVGGTLDLSNSGVVAAGIVNVTADTIVFTDSDVAAVSFNIDTTNGAGGADNQVVNDTVLVVTDFTVDAVVNYDDGAVAASATDETVASGVDAGTWALDSSQVFIPYVPFGDNTQVILDVSNTGATDAAVNVRCLGTDTTAWVSLPSIGTANAMSTTKLGDALGTALQASSCVKTGATNGRVSLEITSEAKTSAITVYSGFKVLSEDDRAFTGIYGALASSNQ